MRTRRKIMLTVAAVAAVGIVAAATGGHGSSGGSSGGSGGSTAPATVTYVVTGSAADVTYGPEGSDYSGTVPMDTSARISGSPEYYALTAQLQGSGSVTCEIQVNGLTVATGHASGGYNIAQCEISKDPISGQWESDGT